MRPGRDLGPEPGARLRQEEQGGRQPRRGAPRRGDKGDADPRLAAQTRGSPSPRFESRLHPRESHGRGSPGAEAPVPRRHAVMREGGASCHRAPVPPQGTRRRPSRRTAATAHRKPCDPVYVRGRVWKRRAGGLRPTAAGRRAARGGLRLSPCSYVRSTSTTGTRAESDSLLTCRTPQASPPGATRQVRALPSAPADPAGPRGGPSPTARRPPPPVALRFSSTATCFT